MASRSTARASSQDFGFSIGPRINAAGRLSDMTLGIECLLTDDAQRAAQLAQQLHDINLLRREVEGQMLQSAQTQLDAWEAARLQDASPLPAAIVIFDEHFHEGVVGILASKIKDKLHRPTFVLALGQDGLVKGSGRSIPGWHLRDALDLVSKRHPGMLLRFGGHAMAAGCTLKREQLPAFQAALQAIALSTLSPAQLQAQVLCDGPLRADDFTLATAQLIEQNVWGAAFEPPLFCDTVDVLSQRLVGEKHLKLQLKHCGIVREGIWFGRTEALPPRCRVAYRLGVDEYNGRSRLQMLVEAAEGC